jgi:hypothetical protein
MNSQDFRNLQEAYMDVYGLDEDKRPIYGRGGAIRKTETPLQIYGKQATARDKRTKHNIPKGGTTIDKRDPDELFSGDYDRGSGNAAKRRAAALTKPEAKKFPNRLTRSDKQGIKDSYEYQLDEKTATSPSRYDVRKGLDAETRRKRRSRDFDTYGGENQDPDERTISTSKGEGGITKNPKKLRKQKAMGEFREQVDIYDIILSHLLDEGYAETQEQAEVIMVNMSEDWRESICEGRIAWDDKKNPNPSGYTPAEKNKAKIKQLGVNDPNKPSFEKGGPGENAYARHASLASTQAKMDKQSKSIFNKPKGKLHKFSKNPFWDMTKGQVNRMMGINKDRTPSNKRASYGMDT